LAPSNESVATESPHNVWVEEPAFRLDKRLFRTQRVANLFLCTLSLTMDASLGNYRTADEGAECAHVAEGIILQLTRPAQRPRLPQLL